MVTGFLDPIPLRARNAPMPIYFVSPPLSNPSAAKQPTT